MRICQVYPFGRSYLSYFNKRFPHLSTVGSQLRRRAMVRHRHCGVHLLEPIVTEVESALFLVPDDHIGQRQWARERGLSTSNEVAILLAQVEEHRAEIFYCLNPDRYGPNLLRRLPGCVRNTVCWRAAAGKGTDLSGYSLRVCNFPMIIDAWRAQGLRAEYLSPSYDDAMEGVNRDDRSIDVLFVGGFTRHHQRRNAILAGVAKLSSRFDVRFHLDTRLWIRAINFMPNLPRVFPALALSSIPRTIVYPPVFGLELYELLGRTKIVLNAAIDVAGEYRGNMRCFEAMGCGAVMISDEGIYPTEFESGKHFLVYSKDQFPNAVISDVLSHFENYRHVGRFGLENIKDRCAKRDQWHRFCQLVSSL